MIATVEWSRGKKNMVQLKGNLMPTRKQRVKHPRVMLVWACGYLLGFFLCRAKPACNECGYF